MWLVATVLGSTTLGHKELQQQRLPFLRISLKAPNRSEDTICTFEAKQMTNLNNMYFKPGKVVHACCHSYL
jgi:hypothetical protein